MLFVILSYDRKKDLTFLVHEMLEKVDHLAVIDDGSDYNADRLRRLCSYYRMADHQGKKGHYKLYRFAFELFRNSGHDRLCIMPDDWMNVDVKRIRRVPFESPFACNVTNVGWTKSWTGIEAYPDPDHRGFDRVGWIDHGLITDRDSLERIEWRAGRIPASSSSGTGRYLSHAFLEAGVPMYRPQISMAAHQGIPSKMHPEERQKNPLIPK